MKTLYRAGMPRLVHEDREITRAQSIAACIIETFNGRR
jgi:hypothetical protein